MNRLTTTFKPAPPANLPQNPAAPSAVTVEGIMMRDGVCRAEAALYANPQIQAAIRDGKDFRLA